MIRILFSHLLLIFLIDITIYCLQNSDGVRLIDTHPIIIQLSSFVFQWPGSLNDFGFVILSLILLLFYLVKYWLHCICLICKIPWIHFCKIYYFIRGKIYQSIVDIMIFIQPRRIDNDVWLAKNRCILWKPVLLNIKCLDVFARLVLPNMFYVFIHPYL